MTEDPHERYALAVVESLHQLHTAKLIPGTTGTLNNAIILKKANWADDPLVVIVKMTGEGIHTKMTVVERELPPVPSKPSRPPFNSPEVQIGQWLWRLSTLAREPTAQRALSWAAGALARGEHELEPSDTRHFPDDIFHKEG